MSGAQLALIWLRARLPRSLRRLLPLVVIALLAVLLLAQLLDPTEALARVGGGQSYGGSSHSSSSSHSGGGGGGGGGDLVFFLLWLCIEHPVIGIPITIAVVIVLIVKARIGKRWEGVGGGSYRPAPRPVPPGQLAHHREPSVNLRALQEMDANFSVPAFLDFAQVVYARCQQERARGSLAVVAAYLSPGARATLEQRSQGLEGIRDVVFGTTRLASAARRGDRLVVEVHYETNLTEQRGGHSQQLLVTERWTFRKRVGTLSPSPTQLVAMACPSCGNPAETRPDGSCVHCDTPIGAGQALWEVTEPSLVHQEPIKPPPLSLGAGEEAGTGLPTVYDPMLGPQLRAFSTRHPDFQLPAFQQKVRASFLQLQQAWTEGRWEKARVLQTDHLYQSHRYWMDRYQRFGLRNVLEQVEVLEVTLVKLTADAFYEAATVRIKARMIDYTVDKGGAVLGGHKSKLRTFSEYWTFIRSAGKHSERQGDMLHCPACGAPLDRLSQTGVCGYCDAKIASGAHDWVLSSIEQDEAYQG
jgi:predicted lipid-binding transport protein (Tim44 family)